MKISDYSKFGDLLIDYSNILWICIWIDVFNNVWQILPIIQMNLFPRYNRYSNIKFVFWWKKLKIWEKIKDKKVFLMKKIWNEILI